ncbi:MAG TPA: helix-turn-helix domain-containing protein [Microvirga sp.]|jgi:excisionase family DNA binding protein|nr:helix-turn-helix domain-containing protein [Microvirga sp.]
MNEPLTYSIIEATKATGVGRSCLYEEIGKGRLRAVKRGRRTLILAEDLRAWLASLPAAPAPTSHR